MFGNAFRVARIYGIDIEIHPSWLLIVSFLAWTLSDTVLPDLYEGWSTGAYWTVGIVSAVLLFVTVLIHEMAHAVVAIRRGLPVPKITLFIFGGVSHLAEQPRTAREEFLIAAAGPATSFLIAVTCGLIALLANGQNEKIEAIFTYLATVNVSLGVFNLLPGFPLDGGRVLRSIAWGRTKSFRRATEVAGNVGMVMGWGIILGGVLFALNGYVLNGVWFVFVGLFLLNAARGEASGVQLDALLRGITARNVMQAEWPTVTPGASIAAIVDEQMIGHGERAVVVALGDSVLGILTVNDVRRVDRGEWHNTPAQQLMTPRERVVTVPATMRAVDVLQLLGERQLNQVPVIEDGRMVGLITRRDLVDRLQLAATLSRGRFSAEA